jgi:Arc/MetJ-type ribon-helix-helix transcriptional regulator
MTAYTKLAVSLPSRAAEHVKREVKEGRAMSVSAYIADAIEEKSKREDLRVLLDQMLEETGGPMTPAERRETERLIGIKKPRRGPPARKTR